MKHILESERVRLKSTLAQVSNSKQKLECRISKIENTIKKGTKEISQLIILKDRVSAKRDLEQYIAESNMGGFKNRLHELEKLLLSPYFARVDFRVHKSTSPSKLYIGKFGLQGANKKYGIIDWRAPIASLYYNYIGPTKNALYEVIPRFAEEPKIKYPGEIKLKRTLEIENGKFLSYYDHDVQKEMKGEGSIRLLRARLEKKTGGVLEDIIETIQYKQNQIIRAVPNVVCVVQGAVGSGKTTVAVHRMTYLFYNYKSQITEQNTLLLTSSPLILSYIASVLPEIGIYRITQSDYQRLLISVLETNGVRIRVGQIKSWNENDDVELEFKGAIYFKEILDNYTNHIENSLLKKLSLSELHKKRALIENFKQLSGQPIYKRLEIIENELKGELAAIERQMQRSSRDDETEKLRKEYAETLVAQEFIQSITVKRDPTTVYLELLRDPTLLKKLSPVKIPKRCIVALSRKSIENLDNIDLAAIYYLTYNIFGVVKPQRYVHIVADEAQDLSLLDFFVLKTLSAGNGFTILGDLNQAIGPAGTISNWNDLETIFGKENINFFELGVSYRLTEDLVFFAKKVLEQFKEVRYLPKAFSRSGPRPQIKRFKSRELLLKAILSEVKEVRKKETKKSIGIIECDEERFKQTAEYFLSKLKIPEVSIVTSEQFNKFTKTGIYVLPKDLVKGLEFDTVFLIDPNKTLFQKHFTDAKRLFVCLTRAINRLHIFHCGDLTSLIQERTTG